MIKPATEAEKDRFQRIQDIGCIACYLDGHPRTPAEIHHITDTGRRISHSHTIPLCPWHHRGVPPDKGTPSLAHSKKKFVEKYGTEAHLLGVVNAKLKLMEDER